MVSASAPTAGAGPPADPADRALDMDIEPEGWHVAPEGWCPRGTARAHRMAVGEIHAHDTTEEGGHTSCEINAHDTTVGEIYAHGTTQKVTSAGLEPRPRAP